MRAGRVVSPITVGRERELQQLIVELETARLGRGRVTVVVGEAGVGKSRVAADLSVIASGVRMRVLQGRAVESAAPVPYRIIASALLPGFRRSGPPDDPALGPYRSALGLIVPEWAGDARASADNSSLAVLEACGRLLHVLAGQSGLLLVLEDAHWADAETLGLLDYLTDTVAEERVLCLVTVRSGERGAGRFVDRCAASDAASVLELHRLATSDVAQQLGALLATGTPPAPLVEAVSAQAEGLPLLVEELVAEMKAAGHLAHENGVWEYRRAGESAPPAGFRRLVERRLGRLNPDARLLLQAASLLGREFDWSLLPQITGLSDSAVLTALGDAVGADLIATTSGSRIQFRHALIGESIAEALLPPQRAALARRAAAAVEAQPGEPAPERLELAASLWQTAGDDASAARLLVRLGREALARSALQSAESILERAVRLAVDGTDTSLEAAELLSDTLARAGKMQRCLELTDRLPISLERAGAPRQRVHAAWLRLARAAIGVAVVPLPRESLAHSDEWAAAERALDGAERASYSAQARAATTALRAVAAIETGQYERAIALARAALELAGPDGGDTACEALYVMARAARSGDPRDAVAPLEQAEELAVRHGLDHWRLRLLLELGLVDRASSGRIERLVAARDLAREAGAVLTAAVAGVNLGFPSAPPGYSEWTMDEALVALEEAVELSRRHHLPTLSMGLRFHEMAVAITGDRTAFDRDRDEEDRIQMGMADSTASILSWWGLFNEDRKLMLEQVPAMRQFLCLPSATTAPPRGFFALLCAVEDIDAESVIQCLVDHGVGSNVNGGLAGLAKAVLAGRAGRGDEAEALRVAAMPDLVTHELYHVAQRLVAEAAVRDGWGTPAQWLRESLEYFESAGMKRLKRACAALLRTLDEPVPRRGRGDAEVPDDLRRKGVTSREMDVLLLVREGCSNTEIAERLFMSRRTVETHVSHLLAKLGLTSRGKLAAQR